jgi:hypothetical protein
LVESWSPQEAQFAASALATHGDAAKQLPVCTLLGKIALGALALGLVVGSYIGDDILRISLSLSIDMFIYLSQSSLYFYFCYSVYPYSFFFLFAFLTESCLEGSAFLLGLVLAFFGEGEGLASALAVDVGLDLLRIERVITFSSFSYFTSFLASYFCLISALFLDFPFDFPLVFSFLALLALLLALPFNRSTSC